MTTQELTDLRNSILEGRYQDALEILDELDGMSRKEIIRKIESYLIRMLIHLIKNQVEQRLTNSWATSIRGSIREIKKLNLQDNKTAYYIKADEWNSTINRVIEDAISDASVEVLNGVYSPFQLVEIVDRDLVIETALKLLALMYEYSPENLSRVINENLVLLPGGEDWKQGS
ncbi:MAG: DUF29 domain-containing protein [Okeania sp. SIO2F4]|uniref:DUF29 family protein n=1 Tax=Okeania sp. SIO2F4 TaxID=2607790 RepID=UPI00142CAB11|nr:DUF29 family protein [Okeania sp. SIO2F4]NES08324.1 DUF29 domain-containing protein [Okeania sp. SIO2F4]